MSIHEQARAEAEKRADRYFPTEGDPWKFTYADGFKDGYLAGHEAATRTRVVSTVTELDALPVGVSVRSADPDDLHLYVFDATEGCWQAYRLVDCVSAEEIALPALVLYDPED